VGFKLDVVTRRRRRRRRRLRCELVSFNTAAAVATLLLLLRLLLPFSFMDNRETFVVFLKTINVVGTSVLAFSQSLTGFLEGTEWVDDVHTLGVVVDFDEPSRRGALVRDAVDDLLCDPLLVVAFSRLVPVSVQPNDVPEVLVPNVRCNRIPASQQAIRFS